ncbi:hypothetical protein ACIQF6_28290 [Kitasatospora sp. NPDC092948]|uniref:hypothetical protein n=1 Tax=Kitasatospora sp. NPDC092948 TaxID=3364088 RepID=UPI0037F9B0C0
MAADIRRRFAEMADDPDRVLRAWGKGELAPIRISGFAVVEVPGRAWGRATVDYLAGLSDRSTTPVLIGPVVQRRTARRERHATLREQDERSAQRGQPAEHEVRTRYEDRTLFLTSVPDARFAPWCVPGLPRVVLHTTGVVRVPSPVVDRPGARWLVAPRFGRLTDPQFLALALPRTRRSLRRTGLL